MALLAQKRKQGAHSLNRVQQTRPRILHNERLTTIIFGRLEKMGQLLHESLLLLLLCPLLQADLLFEPLQTVGQLLTQRQQALLRFGSPLVQARVDGGGLCKPRVKREA
jgi:hypothetical protein